MPVTINDAIVAVNAAYSVAASPAQNVSALEQLYSTVPSANIATVAAATVEVTLPSGVSGPTAANGVSAILASANNTATNAGVNGQAMKDALFSELQRLYGNQPVPEVTGSNLMTLVNSITSRNTGKTGAITSLKPIFADATNTVNFPSPLPTNIYIPLISNTIYTVDGKYHRYNSGPKTVSVYSDSAGTALLQTLTVGSKITLGGKQKELLGIGTMMFGDTDPDPQCLVRGSRVATKQGLVNVEDIKTGDRVLTADGREVSVKVYKTTLTTTETSAPYLIPKGYMGLKADLKLSPLHAFQIGKDVWHSPRYAATLTKKVQQYDLGKEVTYYHLECPNFFTDNLLVDGCVVESYGLNQAKGISAVYTFNPTLKGFTRISNVIVKRA
jgi:hypothetical protein